MQFALIYGILFLIIVTICFYHADIADQFDPSRIIVYGNRVQCFARSQTREGYRITVFRDLHTVQFSAYIYDIRCSYRIA